MGAGVDLLVEHWRATPEDYGNLSARDANMMASFQGAMLEWADDDPSPVETLDEMQAMYLRWADRGKRNPGGWGKAEDVALGWPRVAAFLGATLPQARALHSDNPHMKNAQEDDVKSVRAFIRERYENMHFPQRGNA